MPEYIRKQAVLNLIDDLEFGNAIASDYDKVHEFQKLYDAVESIPPADVAPVVHARWIEDEYAYATCSHCGYEMEHPEEKTPYCPQCGARMEGEEQ